MTPPPAEALVALGRVGRPHGVRGALRVVPFNPGSDLLGTLATVHLDAGSPVGLRSVRRAGDHWVIELDGVTSREAAAALTHQEVRVPRSVLPALTEGFYLGDLVGRTVVDEAGAVLGRVAGVTSAGENELLEVEDEAGRWLLPAVDAFLVGTDAESGTLTVRIPEGLREVNR